jgi:CheY-like chemotaxis protein
MDANSPILVAEDDENDAFILKRAMAQAGATCPVHFCRDGLAVQAYLQGDDPYGDRTRFAWPWVLIVDLKMPRMDGLELLKWLRTHSEFNFIPAVVLTASRQPSDVLEAYRSGARSYFVKPSNYQNLVEMLKLLLNYWEMCEKPNTMGQS